MRIITATRRHTHEKTRPYMKERKVVCVRYGCISTWLTAGGTAPQHSRNKQMLAAPDPTPYNLKPFGRPPLQVLSRSITSAQEKFDTPMDLASPNACTSSIAPHVSLRNIVVKKQRAADTPHHWHTSSAPYWHVGKHLPVRHGCAFLERPLGWVALFKRHEADGEKTMEG